MDMGGNISLSRSLGCGKSIIYLFPRNFSQENAGIEKDEGRGKKVRPHPRAINTAPAYFSRLKVPQKN